MQLVIRHDEGDDETFEFDPESLTNREVMALEDAIDMTFSEWQERFNRGSLTAITAAIWMVKQRTNPGLKFEDVEFTLGQFSTIATDDEKRALLATLTGPPRDQFLASLDAEERTRLTRPVPKDRSASKTSKTST